MLEQKRKELEYEYLRTGLNKNTLRLSRKLDALILEEQLKKLNELREKK